MTWVELTELVMRSEEPACLELLAEGASQRWPLTYLLRIHSRLNKLRAARERRELRALSDRSP